MSRFTEGYNHFMGQYGGMVAGGGSMNTLLTGCGAALSVEVGDAGRAALLGLASACLGVLTVDSAMRFDRAQLAAAGAPQATPVLPPQ